MMIRESIRRLSTGAIVDKLYNIAQLSTQHEIQIKLGQMVKTYLQQKETTLVNLFNGMIDRWTIEQPQKVVLWIPKMNNNEDKKFTFNDLHKQSSRLANVLTGKEFNLTPGKTVLVVLPRDNPERIFLQIACSQSGLIYCPYDPKDLTNGDEISQRIQKLAIDCIITNENNLEIASKYTHNSLRPLKKGLITKCSTSEPLPVGWNNLMYSANNVENVYTKKIDNSSNTPVLRLLSNNNQVIQYSQKDFNLHLLITALWLNMTKTSRLIWMKNQNEIISIAPWIFGSSIFLKETENFQTILNTLEKNPIDTFCASSIDYQLLENQEQQENKTHLTQLFSTEPIDYSTKKRWHSLTNLDIYDDYDQFNDESMLKSFSNNMKQKTEYEDIQFSLSKNSPTSRIPLKKFVYQYPINQDQVHGKLLQV